MFSISLLFVLLKFCDALHEGDYCTLETRAGGGVCTIFNNCSYAVRLIKENPQKHPKICGFNGITPIVCCPQTDDTIKVDNNKTKTGEKSTRICQRYYNPRFWEWYNSVLKKLYPNQAAEMPFQAAGASLVGYMEFPHMVAVAFLKNKTEKKWLCGGSLLTSTVVLTAAHCGNSKHYGPPRYVRVGDLDLKQPLPGVNYEEAEIAEVILYPSYDPSKFYHDIALLRLKSSLVFVIKPVCLHTEKTLPTLKPGEVVTAAGWGRTEANPQNSRLLKVDVPVIDHERCAKLYENAAKDVLPAGIVDELQICAGASGKDTCGGDSGGPLHVKVNKTSVGEDYFVIVGITSFGRGCGIQDAAGIYTRVASYIKWIEDVLWANETLFLGDLGISEEFAQYLPQLDSGVFEP